VDPEILLPLRTAGVPLMEGAECATATIQKLAEYYEFKKNTSRRLTTPTIERLDQKLSSGIMPAELAFQLFEQFGIPAAPSAFARSVDEAAVAAERIGFPVALKIESAQITHKSDIGGVALGLANVNEVWAAYERIRNDVRRRVPTAKIDGVVVQRMAGEGVEVILGIKRDPLFGPVVLCGFGGILVELLRDIVVGIPPLSLEQARDMLVRLRGFPILSGLRGKSPADIDALCHAIVRVSHLAVSLGDQLAGLDINPLIVLPKGQGVVAVDAVVEIK
jgi:acetyltransferase